MKKYIITTHERPDRHRLCAQEMEVQKCGDAIIDVAPAVQEETAVEVMRRHKRLIHHAYQDPCVLIMEDDVQFVAPGALQYFLKLLPSLPADWDLFLGGLSSGTLNPSGVTGISIVDTFTGLHCYVVNQKFYDRFLEAPEGAILDIWLARESQGKAYCADPIVARFYSGYSDHNKCWIDAAPYLNHFKHWLG